MQIEYAWKTQILEYLDTLVNAVQLIGLSIPLLLAVKAPLEAWTWSLLLNSHMISQYPKM